MMDLPFFDVACVLRVVSIELWWIHLSQRHKTTLQLVRYPPQFSTHHLSTQATSTQGKSIIRYNLTSVFIFYQPMNFCIILNFILFIVQHQDCISGHVTY